MSKAEFTMFAIISIVMAFTFSCHTDGGDCNASQDDSIERSTMTYAGQTYKTLRICAQTWMAENLNYATEGSRCYNDEPEYCEKYGRLYNWTTANVVCPSGWHLPSDAEWNELMIAVGGSAKTAGEHLKDKFDWYTCESDGGHYYRWCKDTYGFSALPGGFGVYTYFTGIHDEGRWWSSSIDVGNDTRYWSMNYATNPVGNRSDITKTGLFPYAVYGIKYFF